MSEKLKANAPPSGFECTACGKSHLFGGYVAAHWNERLTHTCDCGAQHYVQSGDVRPVPKLASRKRKGTP